MEKRVADISQRLRTDSTYTGSPIPSLKAGLPKAIESLCPECGREVAARQFAENGKVFMEKTCTKCGGFRVLISSSASFFSRMEGWQLKDNSGVTNPAVLEGIRCPADCGLCSMHTSHAVVGLVDLTNRCNLRCPICFADANVAANLYEPGLELVKKMLQTLRDIRPVPCRIVQFSGGEPTLHPRFHDIVRLARELCFSQIQVATNGLLLADPAFARKARDSGLDLLYLQFDGVGNDVYRQMRGAPLWERKLEVIESARQAGLYIVFVMTVVKGQNDHQIGDLVRLALDNLDVVTGISFQPVTFTGRINRHEREAMRYTLADLARDVETQTGFAKADEDWVPLHCTVPFTNLISAVTGDAIPSLTCHPQCASGTYLFADQRSKTVIPVTRFLDVGAMLPQMLALARSAHKSRVRFYSKARAWRVLKKYFRGEKAPPDLTFTRFIQTVQRMTDGSYAREENDDPRPESTRSYKTLMLAGMHFMDDYDYDIARVKRCVIQYSAPNGLLYPFCTYNSGPTHRQHVERDYSTPFVAAESGRLTCASCS